ncbi:MAG: hypothetical protein ACFE9I_01785 [Candidatus Hermodarchaeota archaeon]
MFYTILDDLILYQFLHFIKRYSNYEIKLYNYFFKKTQINPYVIIPIRIADTNYIFFFIDQNNYFQAKTYLNSIRHEIRNKKILIIRFDNILINLIFNFFPDLCIHDININVNNKEGKYEISICFLRKLNAYHIAIGQGGSYIKAINELFERYINLYNYNVPLTIKCKKVD